MVNNLMQGGALQVEPRGFHSSTFRLNMSAFCGIRGAFRGCLAGLQEVSGGIMGC